MVEVKVNKRQELNGLSVMLKEVLDANLKNPRKYKGVRKLNASVVIKEITSGVAVTLNFREGEIEIQSDAIDKPTSCREADLENLAYINSGQLSPIKAMFTGKLKSRSNPLTPPKISRITVLK